MPENKFNDSAHISWEITPVEQKERKLQGLRIIAKLLPALLGMLFVHFLLSNDFTFSEALKAFFYTTLFVVMGIVAYYIFLMYNPRNKEKTYFLDAAGIKISKGNSKESYLWNDFECYYPYVVIRNDPKNLKFSGNRTLSKNDRGKIIEILKEEQKISGQIFYLKKKPINILEKICKTFVIVKSEPYNSKLVDNFLSNHLLKKEMTATTDMGMVFLKFK